MGIGTSSNLGGAVQAKTHLDAIICEPSVSLDADLIVHQGEITV